MCSCFGGYAIVPIVLRKRPRATPNKIRARDAETDGADQEEDAALPKLQMGIVSFLPVKIVRARCAGKGKSTSVGRRIGLPTFTGSGPSTGGWSLVPTQPETPHEGWVPSKY